MNTLSLPKGTTIMLRTGDKYILTDESKSTIRTGYSVREKGDSDIESTEFTVPQTPIPTCFIVAYKLPDEKVWRNDIILSKREEIILEREKEEMLRTDS